MSYYSDNLDRDIDRHLRDQGEWLERCPKCAECGDPIQPGYARYHIRGEDFCESCVDSFKTFIVEEDIYV